MTTPSTQVRRLPSRQVKDPAEIRKILWEAPFCTVAIPEKGSEYPVAVPMAYGLWAEPVTNQEMLWVHGANISRLMKCLVEGAPACVSVTIYDGLVLARSAFSHSMNYRSVTFFGKGHLLEDPGHKTAALKALSDRYMDGRWEEVRGPSPEELDGTLVIGFAIDSDDSISAKVRSGPPKDYEKDMGIECWAGVLPVESRFGAPEPDPKLKKGIELPDYLKRYR